MKYRIIALACAVLTALCVVPLQAGRVDAKPASLCAQDEALIFTCPVAGQKLLSICASRQYGPDLGFLQYRYGPADKPEMLIPAVATAPAKAAKSGLWSFSGGGGAYIQFINGKTAYYVYSAIGKWGKKGKTAAKAGVAVEKDGKLVSRIRCMAPEISELGPDFFGKAGLSEVENEIDVPE